MASIPTTALVDLWYDTARVSGTLGNAALLMQAGWLKGMFKLLANVGQTTLSNYILTSLVVQTILCGVRCTGRLPGSTTRRMP